MDQADNLNFNSKLQSKGGQDQTYGLGREIWDKFRSGDELAFIEIYETYTQVLFNYGSQFTCDREFVKDCIQDFFIYLRKSRAKLGSTDSIKYYLLRSFRRAIVRALKRKSNDLKSVAELGFSPFMVELSPEAIYISRQFDAEQLKTLNTALEKLDVKEREAIYYFYFEGLTYEEIAGVLEFSHISSARRLIYRSLENLRKHFSISLLLILFSFMKLKENS